MGSSCVRQVAFHFVATSYLCYILQDGDVLIGTPGPYNWRGSVFKNIITESLTEFPQWYQSPVEDPLDEDVPRPDPATGYYSYLGMYICLRCAKQPCSTHLCGWMLSTLLPLAVHVSELAEFTAHVERVCLSFCRDVFQDWKHLGSQDVRSWSAKVQQGRGGVVVFTRQRCPHHQA